MRTTRITPETTMLSSFGHVPGVGVLPINAFVVTSEQPMLVDTGIFPETDDFVDALAAIVDPADLHWIWVTHADRDHTGSLSRLLELAPHARIVTNFITLGLMGNGCEPIPPARAYLVRHGSTLDVGDRALSVFRPPLFDNPGTIGFYDPRQDLAFSSDCFGAALPSEEGAAADDVAAVAPSELESAQLLWASVDSPWIHSIDESKFAARLDEFARVGAGAVCSTHLPPIRGDVGRHLDTLRRLPRSDAFVGPDQAALEAMLAQMAH